MSYAGYDVAYDRLRVHTSLRFACPLGGGRAARIKRRKKRNSRLKIGNQRCKVGKKAVKVLTKKWTSSMKNKFVLCLSALSFVLGSALLFAGEADKMALEAKPAKLVFSQTINLTNYTSYADYDVAYDPKGLIVFYYTEDAEGAITGLFVDSYSNKDGSVTTASSTKIPKFKGKDPNQVQFQGFYGKTLLLKFRFPNVSGEMIWAIYSFKIGKTALEMHENEVSYNDSSLSGDASNGKVFVSFTSESDGKNYVMKLDPALKKAKSVVSSSEAIEDIGSVNKDDCWFEDYTNQAGDVRFVKVWKL